MPESDPKPDPEATASTDFSDVVENPSEQPAEPVSTIAEPAEQTAEPAREPDVVEDQKAARPKRKGIKPAPEPAPVSPVPASEPRVGLGQTKADQAKLYLEFNGESTTMALASFLGLPDGKSLERLLDVDSRFQKSTNNRWKLT